MRVIDCIATLHDPWLVLLAAIVCVGGSWVAFELFRRARIRAGKQRTGWLMLAAIAAGASVWCTHFIAMLAYDAGVPVTYDPVLTMLSLLSVIAGAALGFALGLSPRYSRALAGGVVIGLAISVMHYSGMAAFHVDGIIEWDEAYILASVLMAALCGALSVLASHRGNHLLALVMFVAGVVGLHFTGMTAISVTPFITGAPVADAAVIAGMAAAVAGVALIIVGTGITSYMIDSDASEKNLDTLRQMALSDVLTGLPNRASFNDHIRYDIQQAAAHGHHVAVVGIDLDKFKEINDLRGHEAGDQALRTIAARLTETLREGEFVARIDATNEYVASLAHHSPDAISWGWPEQYGNFASGGAAMTCAFSNLPKFLDNAANEGSKVTGKVGSMLPPGREIDGKIVSRSVLWFSITGMVSSQSQAQEAAYLFLQWLGSSRIYAWMTANPAGYFDPFRLSDFSDPLVRETYHAYHMDVVRETVARTVPTINYPGATAFHNALDENLMAALTKSKSAEQAMADTEAEWVKIARRTGEDKLLDAIKANKAAWPTVLDPVG